MPAHVGRDGYCLGFELRECEQHCQRGTPPFLTPALGQWRCLTQAPSLMRLDSGNDALENRAHRW